MRRILVMSLGAALAAFGGPAEEVRAAAQKTFDAMLARDGAALAELFTGDAQITAIREDGQHRVTPATEWAKAIVASKSVLLERMWSPEVRVDGPLATLWAPYDFHRDGQFSHCGVDQFNFIRTAAGWRIASLLYTRRTEGCGTSPLGPPAKR